MPNRFRAFAVEYFLPTNSTEEPDWRAAMVQYEVDSVIEWALHTFRVLEDGAKSPLADGYILPQAEAEGRDAGEIRAALARHADHAVDRARRELRELVDEAFEPLLFGAFEMVRDSLTALAIDRMPDFFSAADRGKAREQPRFRAAKLLDAWLSVGRPRNHPLLPEESREFVRLVQVGAEVFAGIRRPIDQDVLSSVTESISRTLSDAREREAAEGVLAEVQRRLLTGDDVQPKKLALRFGAKLVGITGGTRTLQREYEKALKVVSAK